MLLVGLLVGQLTAGLKYQARVATRREDRVRALYEFSRDLSGALQVGQISDICTRFLEGEFQARGTLLLSDALDHLQAPANTAIDVGIAQWAFDHEEGAGRGTNTLPGSPILYLPLKAPMSAGRGIRHSEVNPSPDTPLRLLQIWIEPGQPGRGPGYEQRPAPDEAKRGRLLPIASPDGREGSTTLGQDALVYASLLAPGEGLDYTLAPERLAYVHLIRGELEINGVPLSPGDGAKIAPEPRRDHLAFRIPNHPETVMVPPGSRVLAAMPWK